MTANEYRAILADLGWSQQKAADVLGVSLRTSAAYASGETSVYEPAARLLRLMLERGIKPEEVK